MGTFKDFLNESNSIESAQDKLDSLPKGKIFDDAVDISSIFKKSNKSHNEVLVDYETGEGDGNAVTTEVKISDIQITQPNITKNKVLRFLKDVNKLPHIPVVKYGRQIVTFDGHHRLVTAWVAGHKTIKVSMVKK